jgi:hypothetical protein
MVIMVTKLFTLGRKQPKGCRCSVSEVSELTVHCFRSIVNVLTAARLL